jgi:hypothetical protein
MKILYCLCVILINMSYGLGHNYIRELEYIKQATGKNFNLVKYIADNGYAVQDDDKLFNKLNWEDSVIGYLPLLGRVPNLGIKLELLDNFPSKIDATKGHVVALQPLEYNHFFSLIKESPALDDLISSNFIIMIFNSAPGSYENRNYYYNNPNVCDMQESITTAIDYQLYDLLNPHYETFAYIQQAYSTYKSIIYDENKTARVNCVTPQLAIYLIPKQYFY